MQAVLLRRTQLIMASSTIIQEKSNEEKNSIKLFKNKHPLQAEWRFYFNKRTRGQAYDAQLIMIQACKTVEDFWATYNHLSHPGFMDHAEDFSFFRDDVKPRWEDEVNAEGGRWIFSDTKRNNSLDISQNVWLGLLLLIIGDSLGALTDVVMGVTCGRRKNILKFNIWCKTCDKSAESVGKELKQLLKVDSPWYFETNRDANMLCDNKDHRMTKLYQC